MGDGGRGDLGRKPAAGLVVERLVGDRDAEPLAEGRGASDRLAQPRRRDAERELLGRLELSLDGADDHRGVDAGIDRARIDAVGGLHLGETGHVERVGDRQAAEAERAAQQVAEDRR